MKQLLYRTLCSVGAPDAAAWLNRHRAAILMYHGFTDRTDGTGIENFHGLHLHVDMFRRHLEYLRSHCSPLSLDELLQHVEQDRPLPPNAVVLTMDDGYRSNHALAFPLLREFEIPATIFLTTNFVDGRRLQWTDRLEYAVGHADLDRLLDVLRDHAPRGDTRELRAESLLALKRRLKNIPQEERDGIVEQIEHDLDCSLLGAAHVPAIYEPLYWNEVAEMLDSGLVSIGNHTVSHYILSRCTPEVLARELADARTIIEARTGLPCPLFCYPNGGPGDFDERTRAAVQQAGHSCALTTVVGLNDRHRDRFELRRVGVMEGQSFEDFVMAVVGIAGSLSGFADGLRRAGLRT